MLRRKQCLFDLFFPHSCYVVVVKFHMLMQFNLDKKTKEIDDALVTESKS